MKNITLTEEQLKELLRNAFIQGEYYQSDWYMAEIGEKDEVTEMDFGEWYKTLLLDYKELFEIKGKFVNDGRQYEFEDFVFGPFNEDGFTNLEIRDFDDNLMEEIGGVEIPDEDDHEELIKFEKLLTTILKGLDLI